MRAGRRVGGARTHDHETPYAVVLRRPHDVSDAAGIHGDRLATERDAQGREHNILTVDGCIDLDCLDLLAQHGPMSPTALANRAGLHPATVTGILDRLERGGWVARERDPDDRRAVLVSALRGRTAELFRHYAGMNGSMDEIIADYDEAQLELLADFLRRTIVAGRDATERLASDS